MKALKQVALIFTPLLVALTGRFAAGVTRVPLYPGRRLSVTAGCDVSVAQLLRLEPARKPGLCGV